MKRIVGTVFHDLTDAANSNYKARPMIALRHLAAPADWCRQITGWGTGRPSPQALSPLLPTCCRRYPRTMMPQRCRDFRHRHNRWGFRRGSRKGFPPAPRDRPPTRFRRDPAAAREQCGAQATDIQSVDPSSNSPARQGCRSRGSRRVPPGGLPPTVLGSCCPGARGNGTARTPSNRTTPVCVASQR